MLWELGLLAMAIIVFPVAWLMSGCVSWGWDSLDSQRMEGVSFGESQQQSYEQGGYALFRGAARGQAELSEGSGWGGGWG